MFTIDSAETRESFEDEAFATWYLAYQPDGKTAVVAYSDDDWYATTVNDDWTTTVAPLSSLPLPLRVFRSDEVTAGETIKEKV